ncbi:uncharacterized protein BDW47DRAFT_98663 [Aspergillus candidus]|uniref:Altered inheritance of mitochondria protein 41 n=1 Tax=Aspergillus candidus TaxID=41067 RepID=A0A2I2FMJ4_ASPCN|nr:GatB/YqeY domain-containing protein [Aspergillus candidus]PLB41843.1 GatB/YqeY domain-containing protein [Aspergillus candidus]
MFNSLRFTSRLGLRAVRWNSTASSGSPPLMAHMRNDLKVAMRAKDTARLNVLRGIISEFNNAAKTPNPISTDLQLLALIRKRLASVKEAAQQFAEADRPDLKEKEDQQAEVLQGYAGQVTTMGAEEIEQIVEQEVTKLKGAGQKVDKGVLFKTLFAPGGAFDGKPVERAEVAKIASKFLQ